jgi:DNA-binding transcriptional ArsR family regulator
MRRLALKDRLAAYLKRHYSQAWIASGELQRIVAAKTDYTPQNVGRRLRELENEGTVQVRYERGHAFYRYKAGDSVEERIRRGLEWFDAIPAA